MGGFVDGWVMCVNVVQFCHVLSDDLMTDGNATQAHDDIGVVEWIKFRSKFQCDVGYLDAHALDMQQTPPLLL